MPKLKTNKSVAKRFKITKSGKVLHKKAYKGHILTKKSSKRKRRLRQKGILTKTAAATIKRLLPYG